MKAFIWEDAQESLSPLKDAPYHNDLIMDKDFFLFLSR